MDPVSSVLAGYSAGKAIDRLAHRFREGVIQRWSRRRAEEFFAAFVKQVVADRNLLDDANVELSLDRILSDETSSEVLFDAYRRVALSRSRKLGPRIVGLLTAKVVGETRTATEDEEAIFSVAEVLNDDELRAFVVFFHEERAKVSRDHVGTEPSVVEHKDGLEISLGREQFDSNWRRDDARSTGPVDLRAYYGSWASRLQALGVLMADTREREFSYEPDSERHIDVPGTVREVSWWLLLPRPFFELVDLIERSDWPDSDA